MALIRCKVCGQMVSDKAKACPKCGTRVESAIDHYGEAGYGRQSDPSRQTAKTSPAILVALVFLALAVLALGGFVLYKMVYEPSQWANQQEQETMIDDNIEVPVDTVAIVEEVINVKSVEYPSHFKLSGNMAGFPMMINVSLDNGYPGKCTGAYRNIKYKTTMNLTGTFRDENLLLTGYADGTSYTFDLMADAYGNFNGSCKTGEGKRLNVSLSME